MESNIDIKELWNRQTVPAADQSEILNKISHFRKNGLKKGIFLDVILVLTILFMIFIWIYFKPQFLSTKIGIIVGILPMCIVVAVNRKITSLYRSLDEKQSNIDYLNNLLMLKGKVGAFVPPAFGEAELTPEELEEIRKREERKDRLHQNYLKRKASGAQKRYENKIKEKRKAEIEAKKAAIRAEDIAKGVFVPVSSLPQREPKKERRLREHSL